MCRIFAFLLCCCFSTFPWIPWLPLFKRQGFFFLQNIDYHITIITLPITLPHCPRTCHTYFLYLLKDNLSIHGIFLNRPFLDILLWSDMSCITKLMIHFLCKLWLWCLCIIVVMVFIHNCGLVFIHNCSDGVYVNLCYEGAPPCRMLIRSDFKFLAV